MVHGYSIDAWIYPYLCISDKWMIRHGNRMDTSTRDTTFKLTSNYRDYFRLC